MSKPIERCHICKGRPRSLCPAAGKIICSACCGSKRGTEISCGPDCAYSPFSVKGYDLWLKTDIDLPRKMIEYVIRAYGKGYFRAVMNHMSFEGPSPEHDEETAAGAAAFYILFVDRGKNNETLAGRWKAAGWQGLTNDERVMMNCRFDSRATIIEIQKILDYQAMECVDLLDPRKGVFILIDRSTAARVTRFTRLLTWLTHYPNFSKAENNGVEIADFIFEEFMAAAQICYKKYSKKRPGFTIKDYFSDNYGVLCGLTFELSRKKNIAILERMDMHQCKAFYKIEGAFDGVKAVLDSYPDFEVRERNSEEKQLEGARYYSWLRRGLSKALEKEMSSAFRHDDESFGAGTIGNITLSPNKMIVEVFSRQKFEFAKKMITKYFKKALILQNELVVDLARQLAGRIDNNDEFRDEEPVTEPVAQSEPIPAEIEREVMRKFYENHYAKFIDEQIPVLDNLTPRQAAEDPKMRPRLIGLMKQHLKGLENQNKDKNLGLNIDWILDELKLAELK